MGYFEVAPDGPQFDESNPMRPFPDPELDDDGVVVEAGSVDVVVGFGVFGMSLTITAAATTALTAMAGIVSLDDAEVVEVVALAFFTGHFDLKLNEENVNNSAPSHIDPSQLYGSPIPYIPTSITIRKVGRVREGD